MFDFLEKFELIILLFIVALTALGITIVITVDDIQTKKIQSSDVCYLTQIDSSQNVQYISKIKNEITK